MIGPIATPDEIYFVAMLPKTRSGKIIAEENTHLRLLSELKKRLTAT